MEKIKTIEKLAKELLAQLQIDSSVEVSFENELYTVNIETEESGLLIGFHGETLSSFQLVLGLMVYKKLGEWAKVVVEIGDYRAKREEAVTTLAKSFAAQVEASGQPIVMSPLPPSERRIVHMALQDNPNVTTESEGEGNYRRVVIKPKV